MIRSSIRPACFSVRILCFGFLVGFLPFPIASAQDQGHVLNNPNNLQEGIGAAHYVTAPDTGILTFNVFAERNGVHLDREALLKLVNLSNQSVTWETTGDASQGVFTNIPWGKYDVEVSAVGYLSFHKELQVWSTLSQVSTDVVLHHDPAAINLDVADKVMQAKARKETRRAVSALKSGNLKEAQKQLNLAYAVAPGSQDLNFLLGYLYFEKKDFPQARGYLGTATKINPHDTRALVLLGRTGLEQQDYPAARSALEQAVLANAEDWVPHNLLADTYLHEKNYSKACDEAQLAITKGKSAAGPAQLVLGEALVNLGRNQEGIQALNTFLQQSPRHPIAGQVRDLIADLQNVEAQPKESGNSLKDDAEKTRVRLAGIDPLLAIPASRLSVTSWQPPGVDDTKLAVAPGVDCPSEKVIEEAGKRVQELVDDVTRFAAIEDLLHQALDEYGTPIRTETRKYNYVASISEPEPGFLAVDEYRSNKQDLPSNPDSIASKGFASLALVFHPHMRDNFDMVCEGQGDWHGQASWLVHFRQRNDRPSRMHGYKMGNHFYPVKMKGRAWITADKFQIVRIEAEMVNPMPEIQLLSEHQVVEYGPIPFHQKNISLWLPKSAELYFDFRKHRYYRRHSFDHYMLFSVDSDERAKEPANQPMPNPRGLLPTNSAK